MYLRNMRSVISCHYTCIRNMICPCHILHTYSCIYWYLQACKTSLKKVGALLGSEPINKMFQKFLMEESNLHYGEFMNDLSKLIVRSTGLFHYRMLQTCYLKHTFWLPVSVCIEKYILMIFVVQRLIHWWIKGSEIKTRGMNKKYHVTAIANVHARIAGNKVIFWRFL